MGLARKPYGPVNGSRAPEGAPEQALEGSRPALGDAGLTGEPPKGLESASQELHVGSAVGLVQAVAEEAEASLGLDLGKVQVRENNLGHLVVENFDGRSAYLQSEDDVEAFLSNLDAADAEAVREGYPVVLDDPGYFEEPAGKEIKLGTRIPGGPLIFDGGDLSFEGRRILAVKDPARGLLEVARTLEWLQEDVEVHGFDATGKRQLLDLGQGWAMAYQTPEPDRVAAILNGLGYGIMRAGEEPGVVVDQNTGKSWDLSGFNRDGSLRCRENGEQAWADLPGEGGLSHQDGSLGAALTLVRYLVEHGAKPLAPLEVKYTFADGEHRGREISLLVRCLVADTEKGRTHFMVQVAQRLRDGGEPVLGTFAGLYDGERPDSERLDRMKLLVEGAKILRSMDPLSWMNHVLQAGPGERFGFTGLNPEAQEAWRKGVSRIRFAGESLLREISG